MRDRPSHGSGEPGEPVERESPVIDMEIWTGESLEVIGDRVREKYQSEPERFQGHIRTKYNFPPDQEFGAALDKAINDAIAEYRVNFAEARDRFNQQADHTTVMLRDGNYLNGEPKTFRVVLVSPLLARGLPEPLQHIHTNSYDPNTNAVILDVAAPNVIAAHEYGHAESTDFDSMRSGVLSLERDEKTQRFIMKGNQWLNEGITVLWERMSVNDVSQIPHRLEKTSHYGWAAEAVPLVMEYVGLDTETAIRAYFGDQEAFEKLQLAVDEKLHCTLDELLSLGYTTDIEWTKQVLSGESVEINLSQKRYDGVKQTLDTLSKIFPNVQVAISGTEPAIQT